jgi:magnesium-transporting ATPase (P-type)
MISGDSVGTAKAVALEAGIITEFESKQKYTVMLAKDFRKLVGKLQPNEEFPDV